MSVVYGNGGLFVCLYSCMYVCMYECIVCIDVYVCMPVSHMYTKLHMMYEYNDFFFKLHFYFLNSFVRELQVL